MHRIRFAFVVAAFLFAHDAWGQGVASKEPTSTHIFPAGGRRGTVVPVRIGAECLPPGAKYHLWGEGVSGPVVLGSRAQGHFEPSPRRLPLDANFVNYPKEWSASIAIKADAPLGPCLWRATTGWGGTQVRPFLVGALPEHIEAEPNSEPSRAERITLPVVVNGQIAGERDMDYFTFAARAGEVLVADVMAARIGSPLDPVVELRDAHGRRVPADEVRVGNDPVLGFRIPTDGDYFLQVANLGVGGGPEYVYRITVSTAPFLYSAFPPGGRPGESREIEFLALTGAGAPRIVKEKVAFPNGNEGTFWHRPGHGRNPVLLAVCDLAEVAEPETNHSADMAMELSTPVTVNGRFRTDSEEDWFRFHAKKGEAYTIDCRPFPPGSPAIPVVSLEEKAGKILTTASGVEGPGHVSTLEWRAPSDGDFFLRVSDLQRGSRGGPDFVYRLTVRPARADFALLLGKDYVNVTQGKREELEVVLTRTGGFSGPVDLTVASLPQGVRAEQMRVPENATRHRIAIIAADDARPVDSVLRLTGKAVIAGQTVERAGTVVPLGLEIDGMSPTAPARSDLMLTVAHKPVFHLTCSEAYQYAHRGTIYPYRMKVERLNGFDGEIHIQIADRQVQDLDGIEVVEQVIPRGVKEFENLIFFPETMHASVQHHCRPYIQGFATFTDKWGQQQTLLGLSDRRCMVRTRPPVAKLRPVDEAVHARPGAVIECKLAVERTANFGGAMQVELKAPPRGMVSMDKFEIPVGKDAVTVKLQIGAETNRSALDALRFRATGRLPDGVTVISDAVVHLKWD